MHRAPLLILLVLAIASCSDEPKSKPLSEPGEKVYVLRGRILSRDAGDNTLRIDHESIPGFMEAMTMDYSVRGADAASLPADGLRVEARLHVTQRGYWITDVRQIR